jgi:glutamate 5-kinase
MTNRELLKKAKRIVIKCGTSVVTNERGRLDREQLARLAQEIAEALKEGRDCLLVTSGAIAAGVEKLGLKSRPSSIPELQAAASVGQGLLMSEYAHFFGRQGVVVGQVLLTQNDFIYRENYVNARNTLSRLLDLKVLPIINENDATAVEEIRFGDNDFLAALVACGVEADALVFLTDTEGFLKEGRLISEVSEISEDLEKWAGGAGTPFGSGGMVTKLQAAKVATAAGISMVIAHGKKEGTIAQVLSGEEVGTLFLPQKKRLSSWKHWIAYILPSKGRIKVDDGAKRALIEGKKSLLPVGVVSSEGGFEIGDAVDLVDQQGRVFAKGITSFSQREVEKVKGKRTCDLSEIFPGGFCEEVIHRDALVVLEKK